MIIFPIGTSGQRLIFPSSIVGHFLQFRQLRWWQREAGGQLFARFAMPDIVVEAVTGPRRSDWRTRDAYRPSRKAEQREIMQHHQRGLHFIGDWHTHPEAEPTPSNADSLSMREMVSRSRHQLNCFALVIVGWNAPPSGIYVALYDGSREVILKPQCNSSEAASRQLPGCKTNRETADRF